MCSLHRLTSAHARFVRENSSIRNILMKTTLHRSSFLRISIATAFASLIVATPSALHGADRTWNGSGANDNWTTSANWDVLPSAFDSLIFDGGTRLTPFNNFTAGTSFRNISFGASASAFTLSGNSLTLAAPAAVNYLGGLNAQYTEGSISNLSASTQTISLPLTLANGHHSIIAINSGIPVNLSAAVTLSPAASVSFSTDVNLTGSGLSTVNGILGGWATMSPPTSWATLDGGNNVVAYTAFTDIAAGDAIVSAPASNIRITSSGANNTLAAAGLTDINSLFFDVTSANQIVDVGTNKILRFGAKGGVFNASRQAGTSRVLTIGAALGVGFVTAGGADNTPGDLYLIETPLIGNTGNQLVMNARITNNGTGAVTVHTFGHVSYPNVTHTYSGGTYIHGGRVQTQPGILGTGPIYVFPGGQFFINANGTCTNDVYIAGFGNAESSGNGAIRMGNAARIITGTVTLTADASTAFGTINGRITGPGGLIVGSGTGNGVGTLIVGGTNDYAGDTTINGTNATGASSLQMTTGRPNTMPHGVGKGNLFLNGTTVVATFNLNGTDQTINGLSSTGAVANAIITSGAAGNATLFVGDGNANGSFGGRIQNGSGFVGLTKIGAGTQAMTGANTYSNATTVSGGKLVFGAGAFPPDTAALIINSGGILDLSDVAPLTLTGSQSVIMSNGIAALPIPESGNAITTPTLTANGTTNFVSITSIPSISTYPAQFTLIKYTTLNGSLNFGLSGSLPPSPSIPYAGFVSNNVANGSVDFVVTGGPASIKWAGFNGTSIDSSWDTTTPNWKLLAGTSTLYTDGSFVRFDNSASNGVVTLNINVTPAGTTVSNTALNYTFNGSGAIIGNGGLSKQGSGSLTLDNSGVNTFSGDVAINGGTLQIGNSDSSGNIPTGVTVIDNGALVFRHQDDVTVANLITGSGTVSQNGGGTLVLNAANIFTGAVNVVQGTLRADNNSALGTTNGITTVSSGATLEIVANAINLGQERITISGSGVNSSGALVNNSGSITFVGPNLARLTLAADATVGGSGRMDLRSNPTSDPTLSSLSTGGVARKLTKVGAASFGIIGCTVDPALGDIEVQQGLLGIEAATTGLGNPAANLYVFPGATLQMFACTNQLNKVMTLGGDGSAFTVSATSGGGNVIIGPMNITNDCIFNVAGAAVALNLNNVLNGPGVISKVGAGSLTLSGTSPSYGGGLALNNGSLTLNGSLNAPRGVSVTVGKFTLNGTLSGGGVTNTAATGVAGSGTNNATMDISGDLFPGDTNVIGTLTVSNLVLEPGGTANYDLSGANTPGGGTNDLVVVMGDLTVNANVITINPTGLLQIGVPYRLFSYGGNLIWNGDLFVTGPNNYVFAVNTNTPGQVNIVASGGPPVWNGGSVSGNNWNDAANWNGVAINPNDSLFFAGNNRLNTTNNTTAGTFYNDLVFSTDAGSFVLNGNPIVLNGKISNISTNTQKVMIGLTITSNVLSGGASAPLIIGAGVTNSVNPSGLVLAGTGIITNLLASADPTFLNVINVSSNANWTLVDNPSSTPITVPVQFDLSAGTFSFGQGASAPNLSSSASANNSRIGIIPGAPATFNMVNGTLTISARLNTGTAANTIATINQSGGTLNAQALLQISDGSANASTTVNVTGGLLDVGDVGGPNNIFLASRGTGVVTVASSGVINCATLDMSRNAAGNTLGSVGVVNLNTGGTLAVTRVGAATSAAQAGGTPTATFNFNGGTLRARASSATFYQGNASAPTIPITSIVKSGGAIIDTDTNSISILESLQHDSTLGVTPDGGLAKLGVGTLTLTPNSTYTGPTLVNAGTLVVNGSIGSSAFTVANTAILAGTGTAGKSLVVNSGGAASPGGSNVLGTLTVAGNVTLQSGSVTYMDLNKSTASSDQLRATAASATTITYGGVLSVTNLAGTLSGTDTFKLFSATNYSGAFSAIDPPSPGPGVIWNTNTLATDGTLRLTATVNTTPTNIVFVLSGGQLNLSWPADHVGWRLQTQTNTVAAGLKTNWVDVPGSTTVSNMSFTVSPTNGAVFFRMIYP